MSADNERRGAPERSRAVAHEAALRARLRRLGATPEPAPAALRARIAAALDRAVAQEEFRVVDDAGPSPDR